MSLLSLIKARRSVRDFQEKEIPDEIIHELIEALIWAPSAGNLQARKFLFIKDKKIKKALAGAALGQSFIAEAPLVIVGCADLQRIASRYGSRGVNLYVIQDVSASIMQLMLLAHEKGLGTVWVGAFDEKAVSEILGLPDHLRPVVIVPVGYPARIPSAPPRRSINELIEVRE
ncbi:MAG: nitroreductase family protein [Thermodesulfovibrionales bacterium]|nr:nitroreductase family protein [Thermodesulfovibrionales bacterium]